MTNHNTAYKLPLDKIKFVAKLPVTNPNSDIYTPDVMQKNLELLADCSPEFTLGFVSAIDWVMASFANFQELSHTADVPVHYFEKMMLTMAVAAAQKYLKENDAGAGK